MNSQKIKMSSIGKYVFIVLFVVAGMGWIARPATAQQKTAAVLSGSFESQRPVVSVNFNNEPLPDVLHVLARKVQAGISYKTDMVPSKLITYQAVNENIYDVLDAVLKGTGLYATLTDNRKVIMIKKRQLQKVVKVQSTVSGTVTDTQTGKTMPGVNIVVQGTQHGTSTNAKGHYELSVESLQDTLVFSFVGYQSKTVPIKGRTSLDVTMKPAAAQLENVVVTALGFEENSRSSTSSPSKVSSESIERSGAPDLSGSLSGKAAGLNITRSSGRPGSSSRILIRGQVSLQSDNQPLIVVDGVPVDNSTIGTSNAGFYQESRINDLNPADIKSVQVLKGPSASAIWGSRAANGVIVITTKEGSKESNKLNMHFKSGVTFVKANRTVDMQRKFGQGLNGEYVWGSKFTWGDKIADRSGGEDVRTRPDFPYSEIIQKNSKQTYNHATDYLKTGRTFNNELSVSGGDDNSTFYLSFNHKNENGYLETGSKLRSTKIRGNFTQDFNQNLSASLKLNYIRSDADRTTKSDALNGVNIGAYRTPPDFDQHPYSITYINKQGISFPNRQRAFRNPDGSALNPGYNNPFWVMNNISSNASVNRILGNTQFKYTPLSWLYITERLGIDFYSDNRKNFIAKGGATPPNGQYSINDYKRYQINSDFIIHGSHQFSEDNYGSILVGWNLNQRNGDNQSSSSNDLILRNAPPNLNNGRSFGVNSYKSIQRTSALYAILKFTTLDQIHLKFTGRSESASTYGPNTNDNYFYPSASIAWEFTELNPFVNNRGNFLSFGKIRASYGVTGVQPDVYRTNTLYQIANTGALGYGGSLQSVYYGGGTELDNSKGNQFLKPEKVKKFEFGIDLNFLDNRISLTANQYFDHTNQAILNLDVAPSTGFLSTVANGAKLRNIGTELELNVKWFRSNKFNWGTRVNWSTNHNEVTDLAGVENVQLTPQSGDVSNNAIEGEPFGVFYGRSFARDTDNNLILDNKGFPKLASGFRVIGNPNPDWTMGISNTISYKFFTLGAVLQIKQGGDNYNGTKGVQKYFGVQGEETWETTADQDLVNYVGETIPKGTTFRGYVKDFGGGPVAIDQAWFVDGLGGGFSGASSQFVEDASYVRIRNLSLSYDLSSSSFRKATNLSSIVFTATVYNPFLWTDYSGVDPETDVEGPGNGQGLDYFNPPGTRSFNFSIGINF